jgi:hypothetical protein
MPNIYTINSTFLGASARIGLLIAATTASNAHADVAEAIKFPGAMEIMCLDVTASIRESELTEISIEAGYRPMKDTYKKWIEGFYTGINLMVNNIGATISQQAVDSTFKECIKKPEISLFNAARNIANGVNLTFNESSVLDKVTPRYETRFYIVDESESCRIVNEMLYLHQAKKIGLSNKGSRSPFFEYNSSGRREYISREVSAVKEELSFLGFHITYTGIADGVNYVTARRYKSSDATPNPATFIPERASYVQIFSDARSICKNDPNTIFYDAFIRSIKKNNNGFDLIGLERKFPSTVN